MSEIQVVGADLSAYDDPRWIAIRVSRINLAVTLGGAAVAFPMLFVVPISSAMRVALLLAFALAMAFDLVLTLLRVPQSVTAFYLFDIERDSAPPPPGGDRPVLGIRVRHRGRDGRKVTREYAGTVPAGSFVTPWFTALRYRLPADPAWRRLWPRVIPLWPDSIGAEDFRRTRVALKWK